MTNIVTAGDSSQCLIWNQPTLLSLRRDHRLVATLLPNVSNENGAPQSMLPALLMPEQVTLGLSRGFLSIRNDGNRKFATTVKLRAGKRDETRPARDFLAMYRGDSQAHASATDANGAGGSSLPPSKMAKLSSAPQSIAPNTKVVIEASCAHNSAPDILPLSWQYPRSVEERRRCAVFADLWEKGLYLTGGSKFGGDFLVYPEDPCACHAQAVVKIVAVDAAMHPLELASFGRMCTMVNKAPLLAVTPATGGAPRYLSYEFVRADEL